MRTCKVCKTKFEPQYNSVQPVCSIACAIKKSHDDRVKECVKRIRARRKETRERKQKLKSRTDWIKEAQAAFNAYIRGRDIGNKCISCGKSEQELKINNPIAMVCGHFLSVGAYPELRFNEFNGNLQCTRCNGGAGKYGQFNSKAKTVTQDYEHALIQKIGQDNVDWLKGAHCSQNLTAEDAKEIKEYFREKLRLLNL